MHADGGVNKWIAVGQADGRFQVGRAVAGADGQHAVDAGGAGARDGLLAVVVELGVVQVAVGIDQPHLCRHRKFPPEARSRAAKAGANSVPTAPSRSRL